MIAQQFFCRAIAMKKKIPAIILFLAFSCFAQEKPKAILIDEFGKITCEDLLARSDHLGFKVREVPANRAVVIIYGSKDLEARADATAEFIHRALIGRYNNDFNVTVIRSHVRTDLGGQFWSIPPGIEFDTQNARVIAQIPFRVDKKTLFDTEMGAPCSKHAFYGFVRMLKSDDSLSGYVVNVNYTQNERADTIRYLLGLFRENGISHRKIRIYFKTKKMPPNTLPSFSEYWLVPSSKR